MLFMWNFWLSAWIRIILTKLYLDFYFNRNHVKPQIRTSEVTAASITPVPLESLTGLRSPQPPVIGAPTSTHQATADITSAFSQLSSSSSSLDPNDDSGMAGRGR